MTEQITKHFSYSEVRCKCGCGLMNMHLKLMLKVEEAREIAGIPFVISSGSRCPTRNKLEGGTDTSSHLRGFALDIEVHSSSDRLIILTSLLLVGFSRIGIGTNFIHVDNDATKSTNVCWTY